MAGLALTGVVLVWIATRPSLSPQPQPNPSSQANDEVSPGLRRPAAARNTIAASEANRPASNEISRAKESLPPSGLSDLTAREKTEPRKTTRFHVVRQGETLSAIAQQYYGSANDWRRILAANEKGIKDANKITPGTKLIIPE